MQLDLISGITAITTFFGSIIFFAYHSDRLSFGKKQKKVGKELDEFDVLDPVHLQGAIAGITTNIV